MQQGPQTMTLIGELNRATPETNTSEALSLHIAALAHVQLSYSWSAVGNSALGLIMTMDCTET
jgi:hypothetical protein